MIGILSPAQMAKLQRNAAELVHVGSDSDESSNGDYHEPSNFKFVINDRKNTEGNSSDDDDDYKNYDDSNCVTISDDLPTHSCKVNPQYKGYRRSRYSTFIAGINQFDPYQELTATQIAAFRQVFDMVDKDGGGSIDAEELYGSMKDLESGLKIEEIKEILTELDRDGNGEIDFEEFLYMMTSMSLQIKEAQEDSVAVKQGKRRQSIFFSVITKFAMKHSLKEIERYYASKARCQPHVVGHYAAGARVFGLTDREMLRTWKELSHASKGKDSPYAQPLDFVANFYEGGRCNNNKKTICVRKKKNVESGRITKTPSNTSTPSTRHPSSPALSPKHVLSIKKSTSSQPSPRSFSAKRTCNSPESNRINNKGGWTPRHHLPITKVKLPKFSLNNKGKKVNITDIDTIRQRVNDARNTYYNSLHKENMEKAMEYWDSLKIDEMPSRRLQTNFKKVFRAYSPTNEFEHRYFGGGGQKKTSQEKKSYKSGKKGHSNFKKGSSSGYSVGSFFLRNLGNEERKKFQKTEFVF